ncbi:Phosphoribosylformylglycinamidine cyclo-ligase [Candidatus Providencia siddallii]|uniref:Phosphoribosylformylglycinamidine cyclo-ligase n=1 Tax=Candidatus Providencia siddallii TaxID=1715285 RepID=A0A0M6W8V2_9GAMM|nr:Phosphoribosylformylglycinamidine cyclo-ligase [Candidatus Providencia siddallii]
MSKKTSLNYKKSGVNIDTGNILTKRIKDMTKKTNRSEIIGKIGGFGALCCIPNKYHEPILVSTTDGVGTKLKLATDFMQHNCIGIDLVAMCVNDIVIYNAEPLFFLDYYASNKLDINIATTIITSIIEGCKQANCSLVGGETAEMPDIYHGKNYDLAGFCVGIAERSKIIDGSKVEVNDALIALGSNGVHSNGFSLIRKILKNTKTNPKTIVFNNRPLIDYLLKPTKIYVKNILKLIKKNNIHAIAHITGGGFFENIPRVLPNDKKAIIDSSSWKWPTIFKWIQQEGQISNDEMYKVFNCGVGMIIALPQNEINSAIKLLKTLGEKAWQIGVINNLSNLEKKRVIIY